MERGPVLLPSPQMPWARDALGLGGQLRVGVWVPPALPGAASLLAQGRSPTRELLQASHWVVVLVPPWDREGTGTYTAVPTSAPAPLLPAQQGNRKGTPPRPHRPDNRPHSVWGSHTHTKPFVLLFPLWGKPLIQVLPIPTSGQSHQPETNRRMKACSIFQGAAGQLSGFLGCPDLTCREAWAPRGEVFPELSGRCYA